MVFSPNQKITPLNPEDYQGANAGVGFNNILFHQLASCMWYGTQAGTSREELRKFDRAIRMLEIALTTRLTPEYLKKVENLTDRTQTAIDNKRFNDYYECLRERLIYLMEILKSIPNFMPEQKAFERV